MTRAKWFVTVALALLIGPVCSSARADYVRFLDLSDTVTGETDTLGNFTFNGETVVFNDTLFHAFNPNPADPILVAVLLTEGDPMTSPVSDIVELQLIDGVSSTDVTITFTSDSEDALNYSGTFVSIPETGELQSLTTLFRLFSGVPDLLPDTYDISAQSDLPEAPPDTPEPSSLMLAGLGTMTVLGYGWRRRKRMA
jgi:hypothetical protein